MNIAADKKRTPLGEVLFNLPEWQRNKIKDRLIKLGLTEGKWRGIYERNEAHLLPSFVRDVIVAEIPATSKIFDHPNFDC